MTFFRQHFRAELGPLIGWCGGLGGLTMLTAAVFPGSDSHDMAALQSFMEELPPSMKALFGKLVPANTMVGWLDINLYSFMPLLMSIYASIAMAGVLSREIDRGTAEFLLALPVSRARLVFVRYSVFAVDLLLLHAAVFGGAMAGASMAHQTLLALPSLRVLEWSLLVTLPISALLLLASVFVTDYSRALFGGMGGAVGLYFVTVALRASGKGSALLPWLLFGRFDAGAAINGEVHLVREAALLILTAVVAVAAAAAFFAHRDVKL